MLDLTRARRILTLTFFTFFRHIDRVGGIFLLGTMIRKKRGRNRITPPKTRVYK